MSAEAFTRRSTGEGENYRDRLGLWIPCPGCGDEATAVSLTSHCILIHGTKPDINWGRLPVSQTEHQKMVYQLSFLGTLAMCQCPVLRFSGVYRNRSGIQRHKKTKKLVWKSDYFRGTYHAVPPLWEVQPESDAVVSQQSALQQCRMTGGAVEITSAREPSTLFCGASSSSEGEYEPLVVHGGITIPREDSYL